MEYERETKNFEEELLSKIYTEQLVKNLSREELVVVTLKLSDEYKTEEIADILGISVGTLWDIYRKALVSLKTLIRKEL